MRHRFFMSMIVALGLSGAASGGTLRTFDGRTLTGSLSIEPDLKILLTPRSGNPSKHTLDDALWVNFQGAEPTAARKWFSQDIGSATPAGSAKIQDETLSIRGGGANAGQFHLAHQILRGDGEVRGRVMALGRSDAQAAAGLTLRVSTDPNAAFVSIAFLAGGDGVATIKPADGAAITRRFSGKMPGWLSISRDGEAFSASISDDGKNWTSVWNGNLSMPPQMLAGAFANSRNRNMLTTASFENTMVRVKDPASDEGFRGIVLRSGSKIACDIAGAANSFARIRRASDGEMNIALSEISRITWKNPSAGVFPAVAKYGALLADGDFFEGTLVDLSNARARLSNVLFGLKDFEVSRIQSLTLAPSRGSPTRFIVRLNDGSVLLTDKLTAERNNIAADVEGVGMVRFTRDQVLEIRAGESRYQSMRDFKPVKSAGVLRAFPGGGGSPGIRGVPAEHALAITAGGEISFAIPHDAKIFSARIGAPDGVLPIAALKFVIRLDGQEVYRSAEMTSMSEEASVALPVSGAGTISITVEGAAGSFGGYALLADPAMVK